jgi:signal transduction histidine kinase
MRIEERKSTALRVAILFFILVIIFLFTSNYVLSGTLRLELNGKGLLIALGLAMAFLTSAIVYFLVRAEFDKKDKMIKEFSERKDSYHELYVNFNKINQELNVNNQKLQVANKKLEDLDNLKNSFLSNMSHEIRTPMNSIIGFSDLICFEDISVDKKRKYLRIIKSNSQQLLKIVNDVLDISKLETNQFKIVNVSFYLNKLIDDCLIYVHEMVGINGKEIIVRFSKGLKDGDDRIVTDRVHLYQVMTNLIDNAVKFTRSGNIDLGYTIKYTGLIEFYVRDTGKGISPSMHDIIFQRFRQEEEATNRIYGGAGLGLPISKGIVGLLGGRIWVESAIGKGSTFFFQIPLKTAPSGVSRGGKRKPFLFSPPEKPQA